MSEPLKPCDCGWARTPVSAPAIWADVVHGKFRAHCPCCPASTAWYATEAKAIAAWNRRAPAALPTREEMARVLCKTVRGSSAACPCATSAEPCRAPSDTLIGEFGIYNAAADAILSLLRAKEAEG